MTRKTFPIPPGHEAVRDSEGRATGEVRPCSAGSVESLIEKIIDEDAVIKHFDDGVFDIVNAADLAKTILDAIAPNATPANRSTATATAIVGDDRQSMGSEPALGIVTGGSDPTPFSDAAQASSEPRDSHKRPETPQWERRWPHDQPNGWNLDADKFLALVKSADGMMWLALGRAKYLELRVDTRDCGFNLYDRDGQPLNPDEVVEAVEKVKRDYGIKPPAPPSSAVTEGAEEAIRDWWYSDRRQPMTSKEAAKSLIWYLAKCGFKIVREPQAGEWINEPLRNWTASTNEPQTVLTRKQLADVLDSPTVFAIADTIRNPKSGKSLSELWADILWPRLALSRPHHSCAHPHCSCPPDARCP
jgi:hypothetical protein